MATHILHPQKQEAYFITFTCYQWINLFAITNCYSSFDKWFQYLQNNQTYLLGYVIMPNHFHGIVFVSDICKKSLNQVIANGKRFLAYDIIQKLKKSGDVNMLQFLHNGVPPNEQQKGKLHEVFQPSFDGKLCFNVEMLEVKLHYIHTNPVSKGWKLVDDYVNYPYSSAAFYENHQEHPYLRHYLDFF